MFSVACISCMHRHNYNQLYSEYFTTRFKELDASVVTAFLEFEQDCRGAEGVKTYQSCSNITLLHVPHRSTPEPQVVLKSFHQSLEEPLKTTFTLKQTLYLACTQIFNRARKMLPYSRLLPGALQYMYVRSITLLRRQYPKTLKPKYM